MAKILFISLNQQDVGEFKRIPTDISALNVRYLSSYLKSKGHKVNILFLAKTYGQQENKEEIKQINNLIADLKPDLIGLSLMTTHFSRAKKITEAIKGKFNTPIIWGGIHPTISPEDCLKYADLVCVGEGELALAQLLETNFLEFKSGQYDFSIPGIWYIKNNQAPNQGAGLLVPDINQLPYPDYNLADHYIVHRNKLLPLIPDLFRQYYPASRKDHRIISGRGCPYACTFCANSVFKSMYGPGYLRIRSVDNFIGEMVEIKKAFPYIEIFRINDDSFPIKSIDWLKEFARQYKEKINLPFFCLVSPLTVTEEKFDLLIAAGLKIVQIGLQSGSNRVNQEIYLRHVKNEQFLKAVSILGKYRGRLKVIVDVILDNPYELEEDILETLKVLNQLDRSSVVLGIFSLVFYPGTELYNRAIKDKVITDKDGYIDSNKHLHKIRKNYLNKLIFLLPTLSPSAVNKLILNRRSLSRKIYVNLIYFIYRHKYLIPSSFLKRLTFVKKKILAYA
jgi:radical SAM superfamily enzyme YgiQ (UPF0313 family)